jgi:hypothetical protein
MDLEDCLTMEELMELYASAVERQNRLMKTVAAAMGADMSDDSDSSLDTSGYDINSSNDLGFLPINMGYETID